LVIKLSIFAEYSLKNKNAHAQTLHLNPIEDNCAKEELEIIQLRLSAQAKRRCCCSAESSARAKFFLSLFWGDTKGDTKRVNYANNFITEEAAAAGRFCSLP
jgi:hypothetical protein